MANNVKTTAKIVLFLMFIACCMLTILYAGNLNANGLAAEYIEKTDALNRYIWRSEVYSTNRFTGTKYIRTIDNRTVDTPVDYSWEQKYGKGYEFKVSVSGGVEGYKKVISMSVNASIGYNEFTEITETVSFTVKPNRKVRYQQETDVTGTTGLLYCMYQKWYLFGGWKDYTTKYNNSSTYLGENLGHTVFVLVDVN